MHPIEQKIKKFISSESLIPQQGKWKGLVALSGGADSVCLLLVCKSLGYDVEAVHCNFHLRGEEADRDEAFCEKLCEREAIPFHRVHFDTLTYASLHKVSIEMAARELRYNYFEQLRVSIEADDILVAHHRDDSVETVIMNLIRGTGIHGLQGIKPRNGHIVRPLLCVGRRDIEAWLKEKGQDFVTDSTNLEDDVVRNKIRLNLLPLLEGINPSVSENIAQTALRMVEAGKVFDNAMRKDVDRVVKSTLSSADIAPADRLMSIDVKALSEVASREYTLQTILSPLLFSPSQVEEISRSDLSQPGKRWESAGHTLIVDRGCLLIKEKSVAERKPFRIPETGTYVISETQSATEKVSVKMQQVDDSFTIDRSSLCATLDADKVRFPLCLRNVKPGERFMPFGMKGTKLVSDYLTDRKRNIFQKEAQLVISDADDNILWLVGERPDGRYCIGKNTINALVIRYFK